jgi:hypothetical protein
MTRDELEFSVTQYNDGTLPAEERVALEPRLADHAEARAVLAEYRQLTVDLKAIPDIDPLPGVRWDRLAEQISQAVAAQDEAGAERQVETYRIGAGARRWRAWLGGLAVAASVLVTGVVGWRMSKPDVTTTIAKAPIIIVDPPVAAAVPVSISVVDVAEAAEAVNAKPVVVAVGPAESSDPADALGMPRYAGVVNRPSRLTIASALSPAQDASAAAPF